MKKFRTLLVVVLIALLAMVFVACGEKNGNNQNKSFTITFDTQGGSEVKPITIAEGATITLPSNPTKEGYIFDGWYLSDEFVEEFNATQAISSDITVYAKWKEDDGNQGEKQTYTITFDTQGGSEVKPIIVKEGETINLPSNPTRDGYRFEGWYFDPEFVNQFYFYDNVSSNITLYAKWGCEHTPVLDAAVAPTCTETGLTDGSHCSKCNTVLKKQEEISALGHDEQHHNAKEPTCTEVGWDEYVTCSRCDYTTFVEKSALGHNFINKICEHCGAEYYSEGLTYQFDTEGNYYIVTGLGACEDVDIVIPSEINGHPVKSIGMEAFGWCINLKSIKIPDSVTSIGYSAFRGCTGLTSITIPDSVTNIGGSAFDRCTGLTSINGSAGMVSIVAQQASPKSFVVNITSGNSIDSTAFYGCTGLSSIVIPDSVTSIGYMAFYNCTGLTSIIIPDSVTSIGGYAFRECTGLTSVAIPNGVTSIGDSAFYNCIGLTSISGPANIVRVIASDAKPTSFVVNITSGDSIGDYAFYNCTGLTSITIPDTVTSIGSGVFENCSGLTSIYYTGDVARWCGISGLGNLMSSSRTLYIGGNKVEGELIIPDGVTSIGDYAFSGCTGLTSVTIGNGVTSIGNRAFYNCSVLTTVNWNATAACTSTDTYLYPIFDGCTNLTMVNIGENVTIIPSYSFYNCSGLTSVTIGGGVTSIGSSAFYNCSGLTNITIPDSVTSIGDSALKGCSSLESITIPFVGASNEAEGYKQTFGYIFGYTTTTNYTVVDDAVYQYGYGTGPFYWYYIPSSLKNVTIGNKATSIAESAFYNCSGITSITIGNAVTSIDCFAFSGCSELATLNWNAEICNIVGSGAQQYLCFGGSNILVTYNLKTFNVGKNVTEISSTLLKLCGSLASINVDPANSVYNSNGNCLIETRNKTLVIGCKTSIIPTDGSVTSISDYAFAGRAGLTSIIIPDSVTSIGYDAFSGCTGLTNVTIGSGVMSIGGSAFEGCKGLTSVTIGSGVTSISDYAFSGCTGLTNISGSSNIVSEVAKQANPTSFIVNITSGNSVDYQAFSGCTGLMSVTIGNGVTSIGDYAFRGCTGLTSITIPNSVTSIGYAAFDGCTGLTSIVIPDSVTNIGGSVFDGCTGLTSIIIPDTVTSIGADAFGNCTGLTSITIPDSVTSIGSYAFSECTGLTSVTIGNSVTNIGYEVFSGCTGLTTVNWNATECTSAGFLYHPIFKGCTNLTTVNIGENVTTIPSYAFYGCTGLTSVTFNGTIEQWSALEKGESWNYNVPSACKVVCTDGEVSI